MTSIEPPSGIHILDPPSWISLVPFLALSQVIAETDTELMQDPFQMSK